MQYQRGARIARTATVRAINHRCSRERKTAVRPRAHYTRQPVDGKRPRLNAHQIAVAVAVAVAAVVVVIVIVVAAVVVVVVVVVFVVNVLP